MLFRAAFLTALCLPTVLLNSAVWAQCDAIYTALVLAGAVLAMRGRPCAAAACFAWALCFKLQAIFLLPVIAVLLAMRRLSLRHVLAMGGVFALTALPAALCGKGVKGALSVYLYQMGEYEALTLGAPSAFATIDNLTLIGDAAAARAGILLALAACGAVVYMGMAAVMRAQTRAEGADAALLADVLFALAVCVPLFLPHMHERYFFAADVLALVFALTHRRGWAAACAVVLASVNGYCAYLFGAQLFSPKLGAAAMAAAAGVALWHVCARAGAQKP